MRERDDVVGTRRRTDLLFATFALVVGHTDLVKETV